VVQRCAATGGGVLDIPLDPGAPLLGSAVTRRAVAAPLDPDRPNWWGRVSLHRRLVKVLLVRDGRDAAPPLNMIGVIRPSRRDVSDTVASDDVGEFISESAAGMRDCAAAAGLRWRSVSFRLVRGGRRAVSLLTRVGVRNKTTRTSNGPACTSSGHIGGPATLDISSGQNSLTRIARRPSPQRLRMQRSARP
jgi:hypothetical protein